MRKMMRVTAEVDLDCVLTTAKAIDAESGDSVLVDITVRYLGVPIHCETLEDVGNLVKFAIDHDRKIPLASSVSDTGETK